MNSNYFVERISLNNTSNPTIELTGGNSDMKINFTLETVNINKDTLNNTDLTSAYEKLLAERNEFERHSRMTHLDMVDQNKNIQITFDNIGSNRK